MRRTIMNFFSGKGRAFVLPNAYRIGKISGLDGKGPLLARHSSVKPFGRIHFTVLANYRWKLPIHALKNVLIRHLPYMTSCGLFNKSTDKTWKALGALTVRY